MKKAIKKHLLLEQLEDRIFLSASPLAAVGSADHVADSEPVDLHAHDSLALAAEAQVEQAAAVNSEHVKPVDDEQQETAGTENAPVKHASTPSQNKITDRQDQPANELHTGERTPNDAIEENVTAESQSSDNAQAADNQNTKTDTIDTVQGAEQQINAPGMQTDNHEMEVDEGTTNGSQASEGTATDTATISNENNNDYPVLTQGDANNDTAEEVIAVSEDMDNATLDQPAEQSELVAEGAATGIEPNTEFAGDEHISQIVFVDSSVTDHETLLNGIIADISANNNSDAEDEGNSNPELIQNDIRIITLDASQDEIQQITDTLSDYSELDAVHILSHGSNSSLRLGGTTINNDNLDGYSDQLSHWGESLNDDGDLLLYGCKVAEDGEGVEFIESVATLTGADVAASDDATGNNASGGDWDLEVTTGKIDVQILHDASGNWDGLLAPPLPTSLDAAPNTEPMINSEFHFTITFDNDPSDDASTDTGYGPFADVIIPHELEVVGSPTIFTNAISPEIYTWNGTGWEDAGGNVLTEHPGETTGSVTDTDLEMPQGSFDIGDKWYYIIHPFGSFTTGQPAIDVDFTARASTAAGAEVATGYDILHRAGFNYGDTATNEHGPIQEANTGTLTITPQVLDIHKINNAPEQQTVTGPNYPVEYTLRINIAGKETVNDVIVQDYLPEGAVYRGDVTITPVSGSGAPAITPVSTTEPTAWTVLGSNANDRLLELDLGDLTGVDNPDSGHTEWEVKYTVYFSDVDADGNPLLPVTGDDHTVTNESSITGQYAGNTVSDGLNSDNSTPSDTTIELASIVTYKDVAVVGGGDPAPNAILEWTIEVDISDYYAGGNIVLNDVFGDGQSFDTNFTPTITLHENGTSTSADFAGANYTVGTEDAYDGQGGTIDGTGLTQILFNVSDQFQTMGDTDGVLEGGFIADGTVVGADQDGDTLNDRIGGDGTYATITFRTVIDQEFDEFQNSGTGDSSVDLGDRIHNDVDVSADITDNDPATPDEQQEDHSSAAVVIEGGNVIKETYAVNGDTNYDLSQGVSSGDRITYRLRMELPLADFENLVVSDYLPLPVYDANELDPATDANDFDGTIDYAAGEVEFGPDHTLDGAHITNLQHEGTDVGNDPLKPVVSFDTTNNSISFDFGSYDADGDPQPVVIDLLLTVTIQNQAMVDGLMLTNQGEWSFNNTTSQVTDVDEIVQITLNEPDVHIVKGVVNTDNTNSTLGAAQGPGELTFNSDGTITITAGDNVEAQELIDNPVDADLTNADGSDLVTFAITVYNAGGDNAYDINVVDTMPTGFVEPGAGINLHVYDGTGALLVQNTDYTVTGDDFYANGEINFNNIALTGNSSNRGHDGGHDVFIITYQLQVDNETAVDSDVVIAGSDHDNTATIDFFTGIDNGTTDWTETLGEPTDNARVTIADPDVAKAVIATSEASTPGLTDVVIGETVQYSVTITVPEGEIDNFKLADTLDDGLAIVSIDGIEHGNLATDYGGGWSQILTDANSGLSSPGHTFSVDFGNVTNTDNDNDTTDEQIVITYTAVVLNTSGNQQGIHLDNLAHVTWDDPNNPGSTAQTTNVNSPDVIVQEADLQIIKEIQDSSGTWVDANDAANAVHYDQGDTIQYRITIDSNSSHSHENAFDAVFSDTLPAGLDIQNATVTHDSGLAPDSWSYDTATGVLTASWNDFDVDQNSVFLVSATLTSATAGQITTNTGTVTWESLDNDDHQNTGEEISPYNNNSGERTGDTGNLGGNANDYTDSDPAVLSVAGAVDKTTSPDPSQHTIGDTVTYTIEVTLPDGATNNLIINDAIPDGMMYVDNSAQVLVGTYNGSDISHPTITVAAGDGGDISFNFGDVTTDDTNNDDNTFTIEYQALVTNIAGNHDDPDAGGPETATSLINHVSMTYEDPDGATITTNDPTNPVVTVIEPWIETTKTVDQTTGVEAGNILTYTVTLTNGGNATAYEVNFNDTLAPGTSFNAIQTATIDGNPAATGTASVAGGVVTFSDDTWDLDPTQILTLTYTVNVTSAALVDGTHSNTVDADWSSQDGTDANERVYDEDDGIDSPVDDGANADRDVDTAVFSMDPVTITKSDDGVTGATIGDTITYTLTINSPQGTIDNFAVEDVLTQGLVFNNDAVITTATGSFTTENSQDPTFTLNDGSAAVTISWNLGDTVVSTDDPILITYTATVANVSTNFLGEGLGNTASIEYDNAQGGHETPAQVTDGLTVTEPVITTTKDVSDPDDASAGVLPGEVLTYTVIIENTGTSTAYEVTALDTLPTGVQLDTTDVTPQATYHDTSANSDSDATIQITDNHDGTLSFDSATPGNWDIEVDDYITVTYGIKVLGAGYVVGPHTNTIDADWTNRDGDPAQGEFERVYDDGATQPQHNVDQTQDEDPATFTVLSNPPSVGDYVWFDQNGDGHQDGNEPGISNVHVNLYQDADGDGTYELLATATTDANGGYLFANVPLTTNTPPYKIMIDPATLPNGMVQTWENSTYNSTITPHDPDLNGTSFVEVPDSNDNITDVDFGYQGINSVGDTVWYDVNGNGHQDSGEDGINGLSVTLHADIDGDGTYEYTETQTTRTINGVDGQYLFEHLPYSDMQNQPDFTVTITPPAGSIPTYDQDGGQDNTTTFDLDPNDPHLTDDNTRDDIDFGVNGTGSIGNFVWYDINGDGLQNEGSTTGIAGVEVTLSGDIDGDGTIDYTATTTTANDGSYLFANLLGGTYTITIDDTTLPGGSSNWDQTFDRDEGVNPPALDNTATDIVLAPDQNRDDVDFGYTGTGSLGDTVWYDNNGNGAQEAGEPGLAGVTVTISADIDGDGVNEYSASTTTDANGLYHFDHLVGADYTVSVDTNTLPAGATPTYDLDSATSNPDSTTTYTLTTGENTDRVDFGYTGTGSIGDTVWNDIDGDGIQDAGENGFDNVTITLTDAQGHTITTTTDADGHYSFDNLFLGAYTVAVDPTTLPAGTSQTHDLDDPHTTTPNTPNSASVTLDAANPVNNDVDFGYNSKGTIGDTIWYDANADGIQDADELGLAGVTVTLTGDTDGDGNPDTVIVTTDADGHYLFDQLTAGDYTITVSDLPDGMTQTADPDGVSDNSTTLTLAGGETNLDQDFGYTGTGSIGDTIWSDADGNGHQNNGETGLAGVTVTLRADLNNDGIIDTVTTTTDSSGNYHFDHLPADNYTIIVDPATLPPGMRQTADPDGTNDNTAAVTLAAGETNIDQDFGYQQTGTIGDTIWYDADGDGVQDAGELGLNGVTVTLTDAQGNTVATTTTGSDGQYLFDNLSAGDYTITLTDLPNGMTPTADPDGGNDNTSQITIGGTSPLVNLDQDFGYTGTSSIGDTIWNDTDGDGTQDGGETGLAGVSVTLSGDFNGDGTPDTVTVITDANGQYHFDRLPEGQYTITVDPATLPPGMQQTGDPDGGNDNSASVVLTAGETNNDQDFGYQQTGTIGDTIWFDADGDGIQDPGEPGLANVQVTLVGDLDGDGQADDTLTTVTDANGNYLFDRLPAGDYSITVDPTTLPDGMAETFDFDGTGSANTAQVTIGENEANLDVDFGYKGTGSIGDTIWFDADNDGIQDPGEAGIPGVTVTITGDFDNDGQADDTMTVTTGPDGTYIFPNLPAGEYDITVDPATLPGGMVPTGDPDGTPDNTTHLILAAGEINNDQDFGYTGTGSIGDQLWNDQNSNGTMDPGEAPLAGVQVCIGVDLDGDGVPDYRATTTTGADGTYLFDNLPAGSHSICVNPATLPPGIHLSFDPDGSNDNATIVQLGAGEHNTVTDFGYAYPPEPIPPAPFVPPTPPEPPVPPAPEPGFGSDPLLSYQQFSDRDIDTVFLFPFRELPWQEPMLPVSPVYTGHAEPGTTLEFTLYDVMGNQIGQQSVMADTAGNWLASFPGTIMFDLPHHMEISQTISSYNASSAGFFNMRTYFSPNFSSMVFSSTSLDVNTIFAYMPSTIMNSMHAGNMSIFDISWNGFNEYEFFAPSTQPAQTSH